MHGSLMLFCVSYTSLHTNIKASHIVCNSGVAAYNLILKFLFILTNKNATYQGQGYYLPLFLAKQNSLDLGKMIKLQHTKVGSIALRYF